MVAVTSLSAPSPPPSHFFTLTATSPPIRGQDRIGKTVLDDICQSNRECYCACHMSAPGVGLFLIIYRYF
jgi:hypothetical protein